MIRRYSINSSSITGRGWAIFWIGCAGFVLSMFYRVSTTIISPDLAKDLNLTTAQLGLLSSAFFFAFAFCQLPLGMALDRFGSRVVVTVLNGFGVAGALLFALARTGTESVWARGLMGIGMSCNLMGSLNLIAAWFPVTRFAAVSGLLAGPSVWPGPYGDWDELQSHGDLESNRRLVSGDSVCRCQRTLSRHRCAG